MQIGMRVIVEDYFQKAGTKAVLLLLNVFVSWLGGALTIISILKVALLVLSLFVCWLTAAVGVFSILKVAFGGGAF
jgi:hypothetical protein